MVFASGIPPLLRMLSYPLITRIYDPQQFGAFQLFNSLYGTMMVCSTLKFAEAQILPSRDNEAFKVTLVASLCCVLFCSCALLTFWLSGYSPISIFSSVFVDNHDSIFHLLVTQLFFGGMGLVLEYWALRLRMFISILISRSLEALVTLAMQVVCGLFYSNGAIALIVSIWVGSVIFCSSQLFFTSSTFKKSFLKQIKLSNFFNVINTYKDFALKGLPSSLLNTLSLSSPSFLFGHLGRLSELAFYSLAAGIFMAPISIFSIGMGKVFFVHSTDNRNDRSILKYMLKLNYRRLFGLVILPGIVVLVFAPVAFEAIFGSQWKTAGTYAQILLPWLLAMAIVGPTTSIFVTLGRQDILLKYNIWLLIVRFASLSFGLMVLQNPTISLLLFSVAGMAFNSWLARSSLILVSKDSEANSQQGSGYR